MKFEEKDYDNSYFWENKGMKFLHPKKLPEVFKKFKKNMMANISHYERLLIRDIIVKILLKKILKSFTYFS